ncbi:MAG: ABC transporter permease [Steroidobacteraceae bacterium]
MFEHYITHTLRNFWRFKVTSVVNLIGLALGLVCFIVTYLYLDSLLRTGDLQFKNAARTFALTQELWTTPTNRMIPAFVQVAPGTAQFLRADLPGLAAVARAITLGTVAAASENRSAYLEAAAVDPDFLKIFDLKLLEGDLHDALASTNGAIITESAAIRLFGTKSVVGRPVLLQNRAQVTISAVIGALPPGSHMGNSTAAMLRFELLLPMKLLKSFHSMSGIGLLADPDGYESQWGSDTYWTYVLLPTDGSVTFEQLEEALRAFPGRHIPKGNILSVFGAVPLPRIKLAMLEAFAGNRSVGLVTSAFLLDALVLVIACLNYANLTVAIATTRAREIGMRKVLGASQPHLMRQYLVEAALTGAAALIIVLAGTALALPVMNKAFGLELHPGSMLRPALWGLVILLLAVISLVGGGYPAFVLSRVRPIESLRAGNVRAGPRFVPTVLVGLQFAAASFLLIVALLMFSQGRVLQRVGLHLDRDPVVAIGNDVRELGVPFESLRNELLRDPRIKSVSGAAALPWQSGGSHQALRRTRDASSAVRVAMMNMVFYDFFSTAGINLLAGRSFGREHADEFFWDDSAQKGVPNVIIDRALTQQLGWSRPEQAVDQTIYVAAPWNPSALGRALHVIGVVENGYPRLVGPNADSNMYVFSTEGADVPLVRVSREDVSGALAHIDAVWKGLVPKVPVRRYFMDELFNSAYETFANVGSVLTGLTAFAFIIAVMGLFSMAIHITSRRLREIGIRKTLGASVRGVVFMLLQDFSKPVVIANVLAWPFAFFAGQLYLNLFTQRAALSPWPFAISLLITLAIAWLAVGTQAYRAAAVRPASVLHLD